MQISFPVTSLISSLISSYVIQGLKDSSDSMFILGRFKRFNLTNLLNFGIFIFKRLCSTYSLFRLPFASFEYIMSDDYSFMLVLSFVWIQKSTILRKIIFLYLVSLWEI